MNWSLRFDKPIPLPSGKTIETLADAREYLLSLPKSRLKEKAVEAAAEAVVMAGEGRGPVMHANAGMHQLIHGKRPPPEPRPSTKRPWGKVKLLRDR